MEIMQIIRIIRIQFLFHPIHNIKAPMNNRMWWISPITYFSSHIYSSILRTCIYLDLRHLRTSCIQYSLFWSLTNHSLHLLLLLPLHPIPSCWKILRLPPIQSRTAHRSSTTTTPMLHRHWIQISSNPLFF